jgi:hypothetical protein
VLTSTTLVANSAWIVEEIGDTVLTELNLEFTQKAVLGADCQAGGIREFLVWGHSRPVWLRLSNGDSRRLVFLSKKEALEFCAAINEWIAAS